MMIAALKESEPGETRVAVTPVSAALLVARGLEVRVEAGAGAAAGFEDRAYEQKGAKVLSDRQALRDGADVLLRVRATLTDPADRDGLRRGQVIIGLADPLGAPEAARELAEQGVTLFALELLPRISRAQGMDALSSMATVTGYRAVLQAAIELPRMFPLLMTAAGTVPPARVLVIGAGVAGLQAIATARRLGAVVKAYDIRPAARNEVESLGATFLELPLETEDAEGAGGYACAMDEAFYKRQRELLSEVLGEIDVVITLAAVPGQKAPILITGEMTRRLRPGSVIVDLAAPFGGNCELTKPDEVVHTEGITILGPTNLPAMVPHDASLMYSRNLATFLLHLTDKEGALKLDLDDPITRETLVARDGELVHPRVRQALGLEESPHSTTTATTTTATTEPTPPPSSGDH
ncbi:Re/Si-specific NAD(P)(+) transhydrogenase subunit alpha [soil metagenome]